CARDGGSWNYPLDYW
nr:immunoglobulin heavy chain junction region [Macaca mulatta]MOV36438.1 immunoglobulin heavy chain junction region [Macaca mulatta]